MMVHKSTNGKINHKEENERMIRLDDAVDEPMDGDDEKDTLTSNHHHSLPEHHIPFPAAEDHKPWHFIISTKKYIHTTLTAVLALSLVLVLGIGQSSSSSRASSSAAAIVADSTAGSGGKIPWAPLPDFSQPISRVAFGSCMKEDMPMPFWDTLLEFHPDVTILGGDQVYTQEQDACSGQGNCTLLKQAYDQLNNHPSFQGAKQRLPMLGMLDDHDYGLNDCYADNPYKDIAKDLYFDFMDIPQDDERRFRDNEGLYTSYEWGSGDQILQLILLDTRYSRSEFLYDDEKWAYTPYGHDQDHGKQFLSPAQWEWFEQVLQRPANVRLILSTQQVLTQGEWGFEHWSLIPRELRKLVRLLKKYCKHVKNPSLPVLLSGDRHIGALYNDPALWDELYEVTASSWTHTIPDGWDPDGVKCSTYPNPAVDCIEQDPTRIGDWVGVNHFGMVDVDWQDRTVHLTLVRAETSHAYYVKQKWQYNTDAGQVLKSLSLDIP
ncbi:PhoD-like phosphatase [Seminavis robusta]|uniref:PhoD-like phosphatase n=1 Tax=Seminavis robusta TaxID=568900 RepID=A0A9N8DIS2_9STRA|nr:PhoD-like phosphatase [Seminavis robusta]|eukprot:Sro108_g054070.1 PhoD-like phosphatase (492) ;mRNA; r:5744-7219